MSESVDGDRIPLTPSGWNQWRPLHISKVGIAGCLALPVLLLALVLGSEWLFVAAFVLGGVAQLVAMRNQRDAYFTTTRIHHRPGLLGLTAEDVPIHTVAQVLVDNARWLSGTGDLTVQCGMKYLLFEGVPDADAKAQRILQFADAARQRQSGRP
jgi:hypothetical protein